MLDPRITKLTHNLVNYSCGVLPGEKVLIEASGLEVPLARELVREIYKAGGMPFITIKNEQLNRAVLNGCAEEQLRLMASFELARMKEMDAYIGIRASFKLETIAIEEADDLLVKQQLEAVILIPGGYEEGIRSNAPLSTELLSLKGKETTAWLEQYINLYTQNLIALSASSKGDKEAFDKMYGLYRQNSPRVSEVRLEDMQTEKTITRTSIGFIIMILILSSSMTSQFMLNEKREGIGLVITAFSSSSYMAGTLSSLVITPTCMLGGCFWSVDFKPETMQKIAKLMPQWWALDAVENLQNGAGVQSVAVNFAILAAFAAALILIAIYRLSNSDDVRKFV